MFVQVSLRKRSFVTMSVAFFLLMAVVKQRAGRKNRCYYIRRTVVQIVTTVYMLHVKVPIREIFTKWLGCIYVPLTSRGFYQGVTPLGFMSQQYYCTGPLVTIVRPLIYTETSVIWNGLTFMIHPYSLINEFTISPLHLKYQYASAVSDLVSNYMSTIQLCFFCLGRSYHSKISTSLVSDL